jgi:neopullulanase
MARSIGGGLAFASLLLVGCADAFAPSPPPVADGGFGHVDGAVSSLDGAADGAPAATPDGNGNPDGDGGPVTPPGPDGGAAPVRDCASRFRYTPPGPVSSVALAGEFNQFSATATPMTGPDAQGAYSVSLSLAPGAYGYKLVVDGSDWRFDPSTPYTRYVGGVENSLREVGDCQLPRLDYVKLDRTPSTGALHAEVQYVSGAAGSALDPAHLVVLLDGAPAAGVTVAATGRISVDATGLAKDKHRLVVRATDRDGRAAEDLHVPFWIEDQPFDFRDGLLYFAFTDRFRDGTPNDTFPAAGVDARANYEGGDFAGIQQTIEDSYFDALGVRTLWISPPNANPDHAELGSGNHTYTGYHGYWPSSGRETQRRFGDLAALQSLVKAAHHRGMRVIVDAVLNHVHAEHPLYQQHKNDGWFNGDGSCTCGAPGCDWTTHALDCWFTPYLPDLNYQNFDAMKTMIDDALYWAREADVDGFRVDAVKHFKLAATKRLRSKLHDQFEWTGPLFYLVGETFDGDRTLIDSFIGPNALRR